MTAQGTPTSVATTRLRAAIQGIIVPSKEMKTVLAGMTEEMVKSGKLTGEQAEQYASLKEELTDTQERGQNLGQALKKMAEMGTGRQRRSTRHSKGISKTTTRRSKTTSEIMEGIRGGDGENDH